MEERPKAGLDECREMAARIRKQSLRMIHRAKSSHAGTTLSMADLLAVLYARTLRLNPTQPGWPARDRFLLSKGHGCAGLYAALAEVGFFPASWLEDFYLNGSRLAGHATHSNVPGIEASTGSLGHGLSLACGMALAAKLDGHAHRVFCLLSDGECDEGSTWEAALFAPHHRLDNLIAIVDYNKIQSLGHVRDILDLEPFADKWRAFGWATREIDGHSIEAIIEALDAVPFEANRPTCLIAHTVKGKGVSFMEDRVLWHYRAPSSEELAQAVVEIEGTK